jgi:hypothetical protein
MLGNPSPLLAVHQATPLLAEKVVQIEPIEVDLWVFPVFRGRYLVGHIDVNGVDFFRAGLEARPRFVRDCHDYGLIFLLQYF